MPPRVNQCGLVKRPDHFAHFGELEQARPSGDQQANGELDGRDVFDESLLAEHVEQVAVTLQCGPWRKRHERRLQNETGLAEELDHSQEISARVALIKPLEYGVVQGLDGAGNKQAAGFAQRADVPGVLEQVLDLDGDVVGQARMLAVQGFDDRHCMPNAVEKVGVTESNVLGARRNLTADVLQHHLALHNAECAVVNRHNRAVAAQVFAAAAGLGVADGAMLAAGQNQVRVLL